MKGVTTMDEWKSNEYEIWKDAINEEMEKSDRIDKLAIDLKRLSEEAVLVGLPRLGGILQATMLAYMAGGDFSDRLAKCISEWLKENMAEIIIMHLDKLENGNEDL